MKKLTRLTLTTAAVALLPVCTQAQIIISEVDPAGSGNTDYGADWFELQNTGASAVDITGWEMDDSSDKIANAVPLTGVTSIAAGQTVVFIENTDPNGSGGALLSPTATATLDANFISAWFGGTAPVGLTIGNYGGSGVGLSTSGDAVNIFDGSGNAVTGVTFGSAPTGATFDNTAGLSGAISQASVVGVNGAFLSADGKEIGSPGNVSPVPEPTTFAMLGLGAASLIGFYRNRRS
ncbi:MAG TPA: lamin tail domain-containing protein [Verrucomicrobiae bacterium]|nr:lamin tail domain-containing protein [Verrucomicrobiae bacterium]